MMVIGVQSSVLKFSLAASQMAQQMAQMNPGANLMGPNNDPDKMFQAEAENLEVAQHEYVLDGIEDRILAKFGLS